MKQKAIIQCYYGKSEYYENIKKAKRYDYPLHFDIHILPELNVRHTKGEWALNISWLLWRFGVWVLRPIYEYQVLYYEDLEQPNPMVYVKTFCNLREAVRFSLEVDGAIRRAE